ncbi:hypothetical protein SLE2022_268750 [Rubroshorea leprosula]
MSKTRMFLFIMLFCCLVSEASATVSYDGHGILVDGKRRILISGSIHYPRSTPEMWPDLIYKAKEGGLDVIQTYVFWNGHEPSQGKYFFEGRYDLVRFIKLVQQAGLYVHLRIGPYACAEWNFGGFPVWLKYVPGIEFRTDNEPFKAAMKGFTEKIVNMMKAEKLFEPQGGPIILSQIENEYELMEYDIGNLGKAYAKWAAEMAVGLGTGVPWVMCKQADAPDPIINTCNGFYCENFYPNEAYKPKMWTELWTAWLLGYGEPAPYRPVEDIAFAVAKFLQNKGSFINYYMYHGGTNFDRTSGRFVATPMTMMLQLMNMGYQFRSHSYFTGKESRGSCFQYDLPAWSISILPDCKNVVFNTATVSFHGKHMQMTPVGTAFSWHSYTETAPSVGDKKSFTAEGLREQLNVTWDTTDYLWYMTNVNIDNNEAFLKNGHLPILTVDSAGHGLHVFINGQLSGTAYGNINKARLTFSGKVNLKAGLNHIALLSISVGLQNIGTHFEKWNVGILGPVTLRGLNSGTWDMSRWTWSYKIGVEGEALGLYSVHGSSSVNWAAGKSFARSQPLTWYKTTFDAPGGNYPLALDMSFMSKGQIWINGNSIGRHWPAYKASGTCHQCSYAGLYNEKKCLSGCGESSQKWYHVPRSWLKPKGNLLVVFEEWDGDPSGISLVKRSY